MINSNARSLPVVSEVLIVIFVCLLFLLANVFFQNTSYGSVLVPVAFLYPPFLMIIWRKLDFKTYGLSFNWPEKNHWKVFFKTSFFTLVPFIFCFYFWNTQIEGKGFSIESLPDFSNLIYYLIFQIFVVALPEEFFFRSYLQTRMAEMSGFKGLKYKFLGAEIQGGLWVVIFSNGLFAASHLLGLFGVSRLLTFIPGLIFAWLWARTQNLLIPILYHALCNFLLYVLTSLYM